MQRRMIAALSVVALLSGPAFAQTSTPAPRPATPGTTTGADSAAAPRRVAPDPLTMEDVGQIKGSSVYGSDDKKIGDVSTVLMKPESKTIDRFVVSEGGVLGVGSHRVAMPIDEFKWDGQKDGFKIGKTAADLKSMPEWKSETTASSGSSTPPTTPVAPPSATTGAGSGSAAPPAKNVPPAKSTDDTTKTSD